MNIILIEDDTQCCQNFVDSLMDFPKLNIIEITNNAFQALNLVQTINPDAIILDLELNEGQGNGIEFLRSFNELPKTYKPYILVTTNVTSPTTHYCQAIRCRLYHVQTSNRLFTKECP